MLSKTTNRIALGIAGALFAASAGAATITWNFNSGTWTESGAGNFGNTRSRTESGVQATGSAWSNTVSTGNTVIEDAYLGIYGGGVGVTQSRWQHRHGGLQHRDGRHLRGHDLADHRP